MAASNSPCPTSPSESDSDREPNSHGARVFWGNLKTPEKSRSGFVDPPQTVVRAQRALHIQSMQKSTGPPASVQDNMPSQNILQRVEESDEPLDPVHSGNKIMTEVAQAQEQYDILHPHFQCSSNDDNGTANQVGAFSVLPNTRAVSPQLDTTKMHAPDSGSDSEIEREPVLQSSSSVDSLSPLDLYAQAPSEAASIHTAVAAFTNSAMTTAPPGPRASEVPDLISFDMPTPPRSTLPEFHSHSSPHSSLTPPSQLSSSSSSVTVDPLLTLSPIQSKSPLLQAQVLGAQSNDLDQELIVTDSLSASEPKASHQDVSTEIISCLSEIITTNLAPIQTASPTSPNSLDQDVIVTAFLSTRSETSHQKDVSTDMEGCLSGIAANTDPTPVQTTLPTSPLPSADAVGDSSFKRYATTSNTFADICTVQSSTAEDGRATPSLKVLDEGESYTPQLDVISLPSTSRGETRKRSPAKGLKGKEKAYDGDNSSNEPSNNTSNESFLSLGNADESASDKAAKKERRAKAKREAEHRRQQLLSLSPTSADVLNQLASPNRDSPARPIGVDERDSDFSVDPETHNGPTSMEPETPRMNAARRVPISVSPRRLEGSPLRFIAPSPINLNDPNRTPARRVLLPSGAQSPRHFPIDDLNRTPARRVTIQPSPTRPAELTESLAPRILVEESSPVKQIMLSSAKASTQPTSSNLHNKTTSLPSSLSPAIGVSKPLPFPIQQTVSGGTTTGTSIRTSRPNADSGTAKPHPASNLRQPSSISTSKIARIATKPYSRTAQGPSRLPVTSFMRGLGSITGASPASTTTSAGPSRPHPSPANLAPSRIPSPSKRPAPFAKPIDPSATMPAPASVDVNGAEDKARMITAYKRKRQRMISEDEPDEPPAKRAVIMVRPVIKGMYNKASSNPSASESAMIQPEASPLQPLRPPGPIQVRPVIPGTLRHFETTRSSSRDLLDDSEQDNNSDTQRTATKTSDSESKEGSPLVDTDTASTVTTLSREPTLEELLDISTPSSDSSLPSESVSERRRTTRARKPYGADALGIPSISRAASKRNPMSLTRTTSMVQGEGALYPKYPKGSSRLTARTGGVREGLPLNPRQLQALTDANTLRNQTYLADLQRKVVRRYGPRPGSPSTKIRTIMEKSKEERSKGREARAERRRRREQGSNMSASSEGDYMDVPSSPTPDKVPSENGHLTRHARGPGDEEDYETPVRPPTTSQVDPNKVAKTVKWDRGLARTISDWAAEQIANKAHEEANAEAIRKGCLVRDRATLRLDPLGNVPDANEPLEDLGRERVIVTRFVYDDDVEATRKTKKKKS